MKYECVHASTCLPDYWGGHHLPHVSTAVDNTTTVRDVVNALRSEVYQDAIASNETITDVMHAAMIAAVEDLRNKSDGSTIAFPKLEDQEDDADYSVYAFFVFVEATE